MAAKGVFTVVGSLVLSVFILFSIYIYFIRYRQTHLFHALSTNARDITNAFELPTDNSENNMKESGSIDDIEGIESSESDNRNDGKDGNQRSSIGDYVDFEII